MTYGKLWFGLLFVFFIGITIVVISTSSESKFAQSVEGKIGLDKYKHSKVILNGSREVSVVEPMQLENYIEDEPVLDGALVGISIRSASDGELLYEYSGDTRLHPASNMKLLTGFAALSVLGEDYTFPTEIWADGKINGDTLEGDLFLKGKGDPTLLPDDFANFAKKIKESGIEEIDGNIVGDDTWYDDVRLSQDLNWNDEDWYYGAQISALNASPNKDYDTGSIIVEVIPGDKVGDKPSITISPNTSYIQLNNTATTVSSSEEEDLTLRRDHGSNVITIEGTIPVGSPRITEWMAIWEPTDYAVELFQQALKEQGVMWTGTIRRDETPSQANLLYTHQSMPLSELLIPFMKLSNNSHAEVLIKEMGKYVHDEGSWEKGLEILEEELHKIGLDPNKMVIRDGSGISHINLLPANEISKLLYEVQDKEWFSTYLQSLPVAGNPERMIGGTLRYRMNGLTVQAKTGTISGVSTLSGYVDTNSGEKLIFSVLLNNLIDEDDGIDVIDKMVEILATGGS